MHFTFLQSVNQNVTMKTAIYVQTCARLNWKECSKKMKSCYNTKKAAKTNKKN